MKKFYSFICFLLINSGIDVHAQNITTFAGIGTSGYTGDGGQATAAAIANPVDVAIGKNKSVYICVDDTHCVRMVDSFGVIRTVAGSGAVGYAGDGGPATSASLYNPTGIALDTAGNLYIADPNNHRVRKVSTAGIITTFAGTGVVGYSGDGGPAISAQMYTPIDITFDKMGNMFIAEADNHIIRKINTSGIISTVAGSSRGFYGDGGPAISAKLDYPTGLTFDTTGNLFIADQLNHRIRKINTSGIISTYAGSATMGFSGDGGPATAAEMTNPTGVEVHPNGNLLIAERYRVRMVSKTGVISTIAGNGSSAFSGDGGPATAAGVMAYRLTSDTAGKIFISGTGHHRVRTFKLPYLPTYTDQVSSTDNNFSMFPNPATKNISIQSPSIIYNVSITDLAGRKVLYKNNLSNTISLDIETLPTGTYIVRVNGSYTIELRKK
jgi:sugar lactone lactonase YvrE